MAATPAHTPEAAVAEAAVAEAAVAEAAVAEAAVAEAAVAEAAVAETAVAETAVAETDLDSLYSSVRATFKEQKNATKAARGRVRQVSRQRRHKRRREISETLSKAAPHVTVQGLITSGFVAFVIALTFFAVGNIAAGLTLCTVVGAAWGLAAVLRR